MTTAITSTNTISAIINTYVMLTTSIKICMAIITTASSLPSSCMAIIVSEPC